MFFLSLCCFRQVAASLDDSEGNRALKAINNSHGVVKFDVVWDMSDSMPNSGWETITPLKEEINITKSMVDGDRLRVWVRATDVMGNTKIDSTVVKIDGSPPYISNSNSSDHVLELNYPHGEYKHSSRYVDSIYSSFDILLFAGSGVIDLLFIYTRLFENCMNIIKLFKSDIV